MSPSTGPGSGPVIPVGPLPSPNLFPGQIIPSHRTLVSTIGRVNPGSGPTVNIGLLPSSGLLPTSPLFPGGQALTAARGEA